MSILDFELYVCQHCGEVTVGRNVCTLCGAPTIGTATNIYGIINENINNTKAIKQSIDELVACYYHVERLTQKGILCKRKAKA